MSKINYRILYGGKTPDGKYTENVMEFESEDEIKSEDDIKDVLRTIGLTHGYVEVGLTKIELAAHQPEVIDDVEG